MRSDGSGGGGVVGRRGGSSRLDNGRFAGTWGGGRGAISANGGARGGTGGGAGGGAGGTGGGTGGLLLVFLALPVTDCNFRFLRKKRPSLKPASAWKGGCVIEHSK